MDRLVRVDPAAQVAPAVPVADLAHHLIARPVGTKTTSVLSDKEETRIL